MTKSSAIRTVACALALALSSLVSAAPLTACVVDGNEPFSSSSDGARGLDVDVVQALAAKLGREAKLNWIVVPSRGGMGRALKQSIQAGTCDLFVGLPETEGGGEDLAERGLVASTPYLSVGYVLVAPVAGKVKSLSDLGKAKVGAVTATPADLHLLAGGYNRTPYGNHRQLMDALARGEIAGALVWAGRLADAPPPDGIGVRQVLNEPSLTTRFVIASRRADAALGSAVNQALAALKADGTLDAAARRAGFP
ncbi:substrate-binding periplasmic protein [Methyloversatilis discipulorum]|uniref:substrate-binding periplasmic protein n=1 Tax=Methyloversatilis discipulorum TaxID=1119528 RepID=UPI00038263AA|nr:transporter substrate-binding domain-containing protein [Methyloversatilis discipulorum]